MSRRNEARLNGNKANMFGRVRPIQKGRWNCVQVSRVKNTLVG